MKGFLNLLAFLVCIAMSVSLFSCGGNEGDGGQGADEDVSNNGSADREDSSTDDSDQSGGGQDNSQGNQSGGGQDNSQGDQSGTADKNEGENSAGDTAHKHTEGAPVKENEVKGNCQTPTEYDSVIYCTECGDELSREHKTGDVGEHDYVIGECTVCGEEDPDFDMEDGFIGPWDPVTDGIDTPIIPIP